MNVENFGQWAGAVWNALNEANGTLAAKAIKKATKLKDKRTLCSTWLARPRGQSEPRRDRGRCCGYTAL